MTENADPQAAPRPERHWVDRDRIESLGWICGECGHEVDGDGDGFWHKDPQRDPTDDSDETEGAK